MFMANTLDLYKTAPQDLNMGLVLTPSELHTLRLQAGAKLLKDHIPPKVSVIDMACGYGALLDYLEPGALSTYLGIDPTADLVSLALVKHPEPMYKFLVGDLASTYDKIKAEYVVCLGLAAHLKPEYKYLQQFAGQITSMATRGVIVEFQNRAKYKGKLTSWTKTDVSNAFCRRVLPDHTVENEQDSTFTCCLALQ